MDKLFEIAEYYNNNLIKRVFDISVEKKKKSMKISLCFSPMNFKHLLGLHKLTDIPFLSQKSESLYQSILNKQLLFDDVVKSKYYYQIENRIGNIQNIKTLLFAKELFFKSLRGEFSTFIKADYLLAQKFEDGYLYLFLVQESKYAAPVSFFFDESDKYFKHNAIHWNILSVEEIEYDKTKGSQK